MKKLIAFFKRLRLSQVLTIFLASVLVFVGTACNRGDVRGARPENPPVQAGGANHPYKSGGDKSTNYKLSPDPKVNKKAAKSEGDTANLPLLSKQLVAVTQEERRVYPGGGNPAGRQEVEKKLPNNPSEVEQPERGGQIQRSPDVGERAQKRLEEVGKAAGEASEFLQEGANRAAKTVLEERERGGS
jgi:hypothetical protein